MRLPRDLESIYHNGTMRLNQTPQQHHVL